MRIAVGLLLLVFLLSGLPRSFRFLATETETWQLVLAPVLALGAWVFLWWHRGRDRTPGPVAPSSDRPDDLSAAEAGIVFDDRLHPRHVAAGIVDLAVRGLLRIEARPQADYGFTQTADAETISGLGSFDAGLLKSLFVRSTHECLLSEIGARLADRVFGLRTSIYGSLVRRFYFAERPDRIVERTVVWTIVVVLALFALLAVRFSWVLLGAIVVCGSLMFLIARVMPQRTARGLVALHGIRGLRLTLRAPELNRMRALGKSECAALVPYAVALGSHERWAAAYAHLFGDPDWFLFPESGDGLGGRLSSFIHETTRALAYAPRAWQKILDELAEDEHETWPP